MDQVDPLVLLDVQVCVIVLGTAFLQHPHSLHAGHVFVSLMLIDMVCQVSLLPYHIFNFRIRKLAILRMRLVL